MMSKPTIDLTGKHLLVGLAYLDRAGKVARQLQLHGLITQASENTIRFERAYGEGEFSVPNEGLAPGEPEAVYELRSTGEAVSEVDFIASWTIHPNPDEE